MLIRSHDSGGTGVFAEVTARQAGWELLNMAARRLNRGGCWSGETADHEYIHVILGGQCHIRTSRGDFRNIGGRADVFSGLPYALYLSRGIAFEIEALTDACEVASCWVPTDQDHPAQLITPTNCQIDLRGGGNASRQVVNIIPPGFACHRLVCVEAYIPGGNWAGYPPHKHDVHREDESGKLLEADLEEIYFYKLQPAQGFALQRIYSHNRDETFVAHHNDMILIHDGYHPTISAPGYTTYLLNFLAGSAQSLANSDDPQHAWVKHAWGALDPHVPIVGKEG
ncbi:MAG: 5-deoxy-glucuronate isomerase [Anaerolineae bacterium]|nr:5-deoxy-glucuronate isomerase [Anaerolineae bacterium]